jgi:hypothetical protein
MNATDSLEASIGNALFLNTSPWPSPNGRSTSTASPPAMTASAAPNQPAPAMPPSAAIRAPSAGRRMPARPAAATVFRNLAPIQYPTATTAWPSITTVVLKDQDGTPRLVVPLTTPSPSPKVTCPGLPGRRTRNSHRISRHDEIPTRHPADTSWNSSPTAMPTPSLAMGQWANRLIVGTDTGSTRRIHFYEPRQDMRQFINDVGLDHPSSMANSIPWPCPRWPPDRLWRYVQQPALRGGVPLQCRGG